jgi:hypothetical protein
MSYITDLCHFLNDAGEIPPAMPHEARELASFLALVVDAVTALYPEQQWSIKTGIRCRTSACSGEIIGALDSTDDPVHWYCLECGADGTISGWRETRWDNVSPPRLGVDT